MDTKKFVLLTNEYILDASNNHLLRVNGNYLIDTTINEVYYIGDNFLFNLRLKELTISEDIRGYIVVPTSPTSLVAAAINDSQINLTWVDNSNNEDGFSIERRTTGGIWAEIDTVSAGVVTYIDGTITPLTELTIYEYRVRSYNTGFYSAYSNTASDRTLASGYTLAMAITENIKCYALIKSEKLVTSKNTMVGIIFNNEI